MTNLENLSNIELGKLFPIEILPYNENWAKLFLEEQKNIIKALGEHVALRIEHFGSTAIEGLSAKPTIDILVEIPPLTDKIKTTVINSMKEIGYKFIWRTDERVPYMHFVKGYTINGFKGTVFHIHMGDKLHPLWDRICFRDYLRQNKKVAEEYESLKISLAEKFKYDREAYTDGKSEFVKRITEIAKHKNGKI